MEREGQFVFEISHSFSVTIIMAMLLETPLSVLHAQQKGCITVFKTFIQHWNQRKEKNRVSNDRSMSNRTYFETTFVQLPSPPGLTASFRSSIPFKGSVNCSLCMREHKDRITTGFPHQKALDGSREHCSSQRYAWYPPLIMFLGPSTAAINTGQTFNLVFTGHLAPSLASVH